MQRATLADVVKYDEKLVNHIENLFCSKIVPENFLSLIHKHNPNVLTVPDTRRLLKKLESGIAQDVNMDLLHMMMHYKDWFQCVLDVCNDPALKQQFLVPEFEKIKRELDAQLYEAGTEVKEVRRMTQCGSGAVSDPDGGLDAFEEDGDVDSLTKKMQNLSHDRREFYMENGRGRCNVCEIDLTSEQHKDDHIKGQKHQKKLKARRISLDTSREESDTGATQHEGLPAAADSASEDKSKASLPGATALSVSNNSKEYDLNDDGTGYCYVCKVAFTSRQNAHQHLEGKSHTKKRDAQKPKAIKQAPKLGPKEEIYIVDKDGKGICYVCNLPLTSIEHTNSHIDGKKHKNKCKDLGLE